jgi:hypothetical protein
LLDSDSEIARDRASSFVLGLAGIQPASTPSVSLNLEIKLVTSSTFRTTRRGRACALCRPPPGWSSTTTMTTTRMAQVLGQHKARPRHRRPQTKPAAR